MLPDPRQAGADLAKAERDDRDAFASLFDEVFGETYDPEMVNGVRLLADALYSALLERGFLCRRLP